MVLCPLLSHFVYKLRPYLLIRTYAFRVSRSRSASSKPFSKGWMTSSASSKHLLRMCTAKATSYS